MGGNLRFLDNLPFPDFIKRCGSFGCNFNAAGIRMSRLHCVRRRGRRRRSLCRHLLLQQGQLLPQLSQLLFVSLHLRLCRGHSLCQVFDLLLRCFRRGCQPRHALCVHASALARQNQEHHSKDEAFPMQDAFRSAHFFTVC